MQWVKNPNDLSDYREMKYIHSIGIENAFAEVQHLKECNQLSRPEYYSRARKKIKKLINKGMAVGESDLIKELTNKMELAVSSYR